MWFRTCTLQTKIKITCLEAAFCHFLIYCLQNWTLINSTNCLKGMWVKASTSQCSKTSFIQEILNGLTIIFLSILKTHVENSHLKKLNAILNQNETAVQLMKMNRWHKKKILYYKLHLGKIMMNFLMRKTIKIMRHIMIWFTDKKFRNKKKRLEI